MVIILLAILISSLLLIHFTIRDMRRGRILGDVIYQTERFKACRGIRGLFSVDDRGINLTSLGGNSYTFIRYSEIDNVNTKTEMRTRVSTLNPAFRKSKDVLNIQVQMHIITITTKDGECIQFETNSNPRWFVKRILKTM